MENEDERKKAAAEAKKAKLETLEKKIAAVSADPESSAGKKHRFDDTEFLEESREIIDNVKSAVSTGWYTPPSKCELVTERTFVRLAQEEEKGQDQPPFEYFRRFGCTLGTTKGSCPRSPQSCRSQDSSTCRNDCIGIVSRGLVCVVYVVLQELYIITSVVFHTQMELLECGIFGMSGILHPSADAQDVQDEPSGLGDDLRLGRLARAKPTNSLPPYSR